MQKAIQKSKEIRLNCNYKRSPDSIDCNIAHSIYENCGQPCMNCKYQKHDSDRNHAFCLLRQALCSVVKFCCGCEQRYGPTAQGGSSTFSVAVLRLICCQERVLPQVTGTLKAMLKLQPSLQSAKAAATAACVSAVVESACRSCLIARRGPFMMPGGAEN